MTVKQQRAAAARTGRINRTPIGPQTIGTNVAARKQTVTYATGPMRKSTALKRTSTMIGGDGKRSLWAAPADLEYMVAVVANDGKWNATVSG